MISWFICAVFDDYGHTHEQRETAALNFSHITTEENFYESLKLLRSASLKIYTDKYKALMAKTESVRSQSSEREMSYALRRSEVMTEVVQMLDSDAGFEKISNEIMTLAGSFVDLSHAYIIRMNSGKNAADVLGMWEQSGVDSLLDGVRSLTYEDFIVLSEKTTIISSKSKTGQAWINIISIP